MESEIYKKSLRDPPRSRDRIVPPPRHSPSWPIHARARLFTVGGAQRLRLHPPLPLAAGTLARRRLVSTLHPGRLLRRRLVSILAAEYFDAAKRTDALAFDVRTAPHPPSLYQAGPRPADFNACTGILLKHSLSSDRALTPARRGSMAGRLHGGHRRLAR